MNRAQLSTLVIQATPRTRQSAHAAHGRTLAPPVRALAGFSLVELRMVITILTILFSAISPQLEERNAAQRDEQRIAHAAVLQEAIGGCRFD